ncbi:DUF6600 domain-containing protein, partial [Mucilaginibacter sp.]|uniref:DUF6600 domain-containing protein n=1 Tax=Mucilaginibacter sp. TaxID=1882438 RepID=UPI0028454880
MKTLNKLLGIGLLAFTLMLAAPKTTKAQDGAYISDQEFYDNLQPYGTWVDDPDYGNVWVPDVEDGFRPYATRGHWVLTDYGNTWVSDYPWGWATFHYGRWRYDDYYGWEWIPGHHWAPAWVSWRHGGGYYGWAPLMPGISISIVIGGGNHIPDNYWVCAPQAYINRPNIDNYYTPPSRSVTIIHNTTIINNTYVYNNQTYISGPRPQEVRQATHQNVKVYNITNVNNTTTVNNIHNNTINIYRPAVQAKPDAHPTRVVDAIAYKQQNPNQAIANTRRGGAPAFNHTNAAKLAMVAKAPTPDNKVVRVNPVVNKPNNTQPVNRPGQPVVTHQAQPGNFKQPQQPQQPKATRQAARQGAAQQAQQAKQPQQQKVIQQEQAAQQKAAQQQLQQKATQSAQQQKAAQQQLQQKATQSAQQQKAAQQQLQQRATQSAQQQKAAQQQVQQRATQSAQQQKAAQQQVQQKATQSAQQQKAAQQ